MHCWQAFPTSGAVRSGEKRNIHRYAEITGMRLIARCSSLAGCRATLAANPFRTMTQATLDLDTPHETSCLLAPSRLWLLTLQVSWSAEITSRSSRPTMGADGACLRLLELARARSRRLGQHPLTVPRSPGRGHMVARALERSSCCSRALSRAIGGAVRRCLHLL